MNVKKCLDFNVFVRFINFQNETKATKVTPNIYSVLNFSNLNICKVVDSDSINSELTK